MKSAAAIAQSSRFEPPLRRVLALDAGSRCIKLALVESCFGRLRVLSEQAVDLQEEGLVSAEELDAYLRGVLESLGRPPVALALPQHLSTSQLVRLPDVGPEEVRRLINEEIVKLSGVSDTPILHDYVQLDTFVRGQQRFWVTLCQEGDVRDQISRLGLDGEDICEVTTVANALIAAYRLVAPGVRQAVLVNMGAHHTVMVVLNDGHGVLATSFPTGGDSFTRAIASLRSCPVEAAENRKRTQDLFVGADALPGFAEAVDAWAAELKRHLEEWLGDHPEAAAVRDSFEVIAGGGAFAQAGLVEYLNRRGGPKFSRWPVSSDSRIEGPARGFEIAYGTALQALGRSAQPVSLLPAARRTAWQRRLVRQWTDFASAVLWIILFVILTAGILHKWNLVSQKEALLAKVRAAWESTTNNEALADQVLYDYEQVRPLLDRQQQTLDTLKTLELLQQTRSNRTFWYVLFADQHSYFTHPLNLAPTNPPAATNVVAGGTNAPGAGVTNGATAGFVALPDTNAVAAKPGFVAELIVPEDAEAARRTFSQVVGELKKDPLFIKVDSLSDDLRRALADAKLVLTDRHFALSLELAATEFKQPAPLRKRPAAGRTNLMTRPPFRLKSGSSRSEASNPTLVP